MTKYVDNSQIYSQIVRLYAQKDFKPICKKSIGKNSSN